LVTCRAAALILLVGAQLIFQSGFHSPQGPQLLRGEILVLELIVLVNAAISQFRSITLKRRAYWLRMSSVRSHFGFC
jgi:hypothetical protein